MSFEPARARDAALCRAVEEIVAEMGGEVAVAARDLRRGRALDLRAWERFPSASVIKVAILLELCARAEEGGVRLDERVRLEERHRVPGSGVLSMLHAGLELTLEDLAHLMIAVSDNTASNLLIDRLGCEAVNRRLEALGLRGTRLERRFYDFEARDRGLENWAVAGELAELLVAIERRQAAPPPACERMLAILRRQQFDGRIPRLLPPETPVANKTGTLTGVCHDVGLIYAPAGPLALAVLTRGIPELAVAENGIRQIARLVYQYWGTE